MHQPRLIKSTKFYGKNSRSGDQSLHVIVDIPSMQLHTLTEILLKLKNDPDKVCHLFFSNCFVLLDKHYLTMKHTQILTYIALLF